MKREYSYLKNWLLSLDCHFGTYFGIDYRMTISHYCAVKKYGKWQYRFINWLFNDPNHCLNAIEEYYILS